MSRVLLALGVALAVLAAAAGVVGWLAYGPRPDRDGTRTLAGIGTDVAVAWPDSGGVRVEAATWPDAMAGLGYAHATDHAFALALWRQTARGETAAWFGDSARSADLHARRLGFDALARQTYDGLDAATRARLDAYARGVNAALAEPGVAQSDAFVWLGLTPEPWQPWDALAVERLLAYLATPAPDSATPDSVWTAAARASPDVARFVHDDDAFRRAAALDGTAFGRTFTAPAAEGRALVLHQPAGASALPLVVPVAFRVGGRRVAAASMPGTLTFLAGTDGTTAWAVLLTSALRLDPFAGTPPLPVYSRVVARDGRETLVAIARDSSGLVLGPPAAPHRGVAAPDTATGRPDSVTAALNSATATLNTPAATRNSVTATPNTTTATPNSTTGGRNTTTATRNSVAARPAARDSVAADSAAAPVRWVVRWAGFQTGTDAAVFARLAEGTAPGPFALLRGDGILTTASETRILGRPPVAARDGSAAFAAGDASARWAPSRLAALAARRVSAAALARDARSEWAARRLPPLLRALGPRARLPRALDEPVAFLRSWDGQYTTDAIAPTVFEAWLDAHRAETGHLPDPADSTDAALLPFTLAIAQGTLRDRYGADAAAWQWGPAQARARTPVLGRLGGTPGRRYADAETGPGGHPTALRPGPASLSGDVAPDTSARPAPPSDLARLRRGPRRLPAAPTAGAAVWSVWTALGRPALFVRGPERIRASFEPVEVATDRPGATVGIDAGTPLPSRHLVLRPAPR